MDIKALRKEYEKRYERLEHLKDEVIYALEQEIKSKQIPVHEITGRVKPLDSFIEKARRQESDKPFETVEDICGIRVICLFLSDLQRIGEIIEARFTVHEKDDKIYTKPDAFGYLSVHYIGSLPATVSGPRYDDLKNLKFEIQLRTIAMHAWSTISHYLDYKTPLAIPSELRKDFNALSAMFYIADTHFEVFFRSRQQAKEAAEEKAESLPEIGKEEINLDTLTAYLVKKYPKRKHAEPKIVSELVEELQSAGYSQIQQLDGVLQRSEKAFEAFEKAHPPAVKSARFSDIGVARVSLSIADPTYLDFRKYKITEGSLVDYEEVRHLLS
jgi:putative GTP pyrophosphokinase